MAKFALMKYAITYSLEAKEGLAKLKRSEPASFKKAVKSMSRDVKGQVSDISLKTDKQNQGDRFLNEFGEFTSKTCPLDSLKKKQLSSQTAGASKCLT